MIEARPRTGPLLAVLWAAQVMLVLDLVVALIAAATLALPRRAPTSNVPVGAA